MPPALSRSGRATFALLLAATLGLLAAVLSPLWRPLLLAAVLAGAFAGWHERLARRLRGRRRTAAGLLLAGLLILVLAPLGLLTTYLVTEAIQLGQTVLAFVRDKGIEGVVALVPQRLQPLAREQLARLPSSLGDTVAHLASRGLAAAGALSEALSKTGSILFHLLMMLVALYFLLVDGPLLMGWVRSVSPLGAQLTGELVREVRRTTTSVLASTVVSAAVQAMVAATGFAMAGVPAPLIFGALTFVAAFIPAVGSAAVGVPAAAVLLLSGHYAAGAFLLGWTLLVTGMVDNLIKPLVARGGAGLNGSVLFFAMIGGVLAFGGVGLIIGPGAVTLLVALARVGRQQFAADQPGESPLPPASPPGEGEPLRPH